MLPPMLKKTLLLTILLLIIGIRSCFTQSNDSTKNEVVIKCQKIDSLRKFNDVEIDEFYIDAGHNNESMHVGQIITLKKNDSILLIGLFTETSSKYFYFDNEELIQAIEIKAQNANQNNSETNKPVQNENMNNNLKSLENRYFFSGKNLISYTFYEEKEYDRLHGNNPKLKNEMIEASAESIKEEANKLKERQKTR
jgi:hypothetical protein